LTTSKVTPDYNQETIMYGLDRNIDLSFLKDREVTHVTIGVYQVIFGFDENVSISVEGGFSYSDGSDESVWKPEPGTSDVAARSVALLGARRDSFKGHENGTLELAFSNGHCLTIPDSSEQYESYQIERPGKTIVV
jgi:hypothetical protein